MELEFVKSAFVDKRKRMQDNSRTSHPEDIAEYHRLSPMNSSLTKTSALVQRKLIMLSSRHYACNKKAKPIERCA